MILRFGSWGFDKKDVVVEGIDYIEIDNLVSIYPYREEDVIVGLSLKPEMLKFTISQEIDEPVEILIYKEKK